jgi:DinB superfamily
VETGELLREALSDAHRTLERTVAGLDQDALDWSPTGTANPIGATLAHIIVSEDMVTNAILANRAPLLRTTFAGQTGLSEPMPMPGPDWADYGAWARRLRVDLPALLAYGQATWAASDAFLSALAPADLDGDLDLSMVGHGHRTLGWAVLHMLVGHCDQISGEIGCLKGLQGRGGLG